MINKTKLVTLLILLVILFNSCRQEKKETMETVTPRKSITTGFCLASVAAGLQKLNPENRWKTNNEIQKFFVDTYLTKAYKDLTLLDKRITESILSDNPDSLRNWFASKGWPGIEINTRPGETVVGAIFNLPTTWFSPGERGSVVPGSLSSDIVSYNAALMPISSDSKCGNRSYLLTGWSHPLFELRADNGWSVFLTEIDSVYESYRTPALAAWILSLKRNKTSFEKLIFPVTKVAIDVNTDWMLGLIPVHGDKIYKIILKIRLYLDEKTGRAESAFATGTWRGDESNAYTIRTPFLIFYWRPGISTPILSAIIDVDGWVPLPNEHQPKQY